MGSDWKKLKDRFASRYQRMPERFFSAPGRAELCGNHTDHQQGKVLAAAVELDIKAAVAPNGSGLIRIESEGFATIELSVTDLQPRKTERGTAGSLVRGVAEGITRLGFTLSGFDAYVSSNLLVGGGLSSSAVFETLIGTIFNCLFCEEKIAPAQIAEIGRFAENEYFGKPCGLMDQMVSACGGVLFIDFKDIRKPRLEQLDPDFDKMGYVLCMVRSGADHSGLMAEYASVPEEIRKICGVFGKNCLRELPEEDFYARIPELRRLAGDRAMLRAIHVYEENRRVDAALAALKQGDTDAYFRTLRASGDSSWKYLQNVIPAGAVAHQELALSLAVTEKLLGGRGVCRMQGGGFAGAIQAYVPKDMLEEFLSGAEKLLGTGCVTVLKLRSRGGCEEFPNE